MDSMHIVRIFCIILAPLTISAVFLFTYFEI